MRIALPYNQMNPTLILPLAYKPPDLLEVVLLVAKHHNQNLKDFIVILLGDPILRDWKFNDYREQRVLLNSVTTLQAKSWQSFENFVVSFHCIKLAVIKEDELTKISEVHAGACLNASSYRDSFLSLDQPNTESPNKFTNSNCKKKQSVKKITKKSVKNLHFEKDFFIFFTTANCNEILKQSGIVDRKAFTNYFGPFAGRAYKSAVANPFIYNKVKNIYTVSLEHLCSIKQISKE
ncbi:10625_t:CDS:2 [Funneliformis geosporum]|uniref:1462_t:CDS:1 n=1 Tax=Funneliformis geosporum TaxID=1117311 RepID=A0A9W4SWJ7_9GLOM|nr:1462_t:CDS:2 [Funneliformis geosporum]CAI2183338.1 10625_t:CDS:2 [Funneliformis geosporum]